MIGLIHKDSELSGYQPSKEVCDFTELVKKDYAAGSEILNRQWPELNNRSVIEDENRGQKMFNAFVDTEVDDPAEAWKWRGTRSAARNKGIAMHANLTAAYLLPLYSAQNEYDDLDQDFSEVMRDIVEWMALPQNSNYQSSFVDVVFGMLQNPVTYLEAEYCEVDQTIRARNLDGSIEIKEILDEVLSGFKAPIWSSSQVLITNAYVRNIQRQRAIIKRRHVEKTELKAKWEDHPNWGYVEAGWKSIYNSDDGLFYKIKDDEHPTLVAEETWLNRREDTEITFLGGIYMGATSIEHNPIRHRDNRDTPKYNIIPFGYSRINQHFFYYKSMMNCLGWDNDLYDAMSEITMNRAMLETEMPVAIMGSDRIDSDVVFPNAVTTFESENAKVVPLLPPSNMSAGFNALRETEKSLNEGSVSDVLSGQLPDASQKAYTVAQTQANARKLIGAVGKSLVESLLLYGDLMKDIAVNNYTIAQVQEVLGGGMQLKYRNFIIENKEKGTKKSIYLDSSMIGQEYTDEEKKYKDLEMLEESGYPEKKNSIRRVNPELIAKFKYLTRVDLEEMFTRNKEYWQPVLMSLKQALANDPYIDQERLTRELMRSFFRSEGDEFIKKQPLPTETMPSQGPTMAQAGQFQGAAQKSALSTSAIDASVV